VAINNWKEKCIQFYVVGRRWGMERLDSVIGYVGGQADI